MIRSDRWWRVGLWWVEKWEIAAGFPLVADIILEGWYEINCKIGRITNEKSRLGLKTLEKIEITEIAKKKIVIVMNIVGPWIKSKLLCDLISDLCFSPLFWSFLLYEITFGTRAGRPGGGGQYKTFQTCLLLQILLDCSSSNINPPISSILTSIISICQHVQMLTFTKIKIQKR